MISENFDNLFKAASSVREQAHVPYSNFKVGAAFLTEDNTIITEIANKLNFPPTLTRIYELLDANEREFTYHNFTFFNSIIVPTCIRCK